MTTLTLIRGLPGSGKSTLAKKLAALEKGIHVEADQYHYKDGVYKFEPTNLRAAHEMCQEVAYNGLIAGVDVFISNTFTQYWEMDVYFAMANELDVTINVILCQGNFGSIHGVPEEKLEQMRSRFEYEV